MRKFSADVLVPEVTLDRLKEVLESIDRAERAMLPDDRSVSVRTKISFRSWGEQVTCTVVPAEGGFLIRVESRSSVATTLVDYGVNRRNVEQVVRLLRGVT